MATISQPTLVLTFIGGDLETGHLEVQTIGTDEIVNHSITFRYQLLNGLKPSSNQVALQLRKGCSSIEDIIATEGDIRASLSDGTTRLFTGYLSTNFTWSITETGDQALNLTIEDVGTRLLGKAFIQSGKHLLNCSASQAISAICAAAGVVVSSFCQYIPSGIVKTVDSSQTCKDILEKLLYELGYVYYFDALGELRVFEINCTSTDDLEIWDKDDLYVVGGKAISLSKNIRQYKSARVSYTRLETAQNYLIYRNTTGRDDTHPYCYLPLEAGQYFDGTEYYSSLEWEESQLDAYRESALIEACNAESESTLVGSNEIVSISNLSTIFAAQSGSVLCSVAEVGGPYIKIEAYNDGSLTYYITQLDVRADIIYVKDTNIVRTADAELADESSDNLLTEDLEFVHTVEFAQAHANLVGQYHRYANAQYTFFSKNNIAAGSIIKIVDNAFTSLEVNVLITGKTYTDQSDVIQYTAVGISAFNLSAETYVSTISTGKTDRKGTPGLPGIAGEDGKSFTVTIESSNGSAFRPENVNTSLNCRVYINTQEITDTLDASRFTWRRESGNAVTDESWNTSSKAIGHKSVDISSADCNGRTVFSCEIDFTDYQA